ncbi:M15 family metallopeptidase [Clavibacter sp. VKM Ac-2873]|uniref:M15 family metallopeptidase n=1 Tax=Clavibacter sp. VKM Ac-2873 TaxID=2783813 RepID=UPI00188D0856|nr:M15 family metallopeptidase [Clavibacter sp. VKM Ac-2873]MBF4619464.1 M15 family metallopeptidase [Clavibacter sp. VKM Ac-2873]
MTQPRESRDEVTGPSGDGSYETQIGDAALTADDGIISDSLGVDVDSDLPAIENLDPDLHEALRKAAAAAAATTAERYGFDLLITSGWRSERFQDQLLKDGIEKYGSEKAARKYVASSEDSRHVSGDAVDIADPDAQLWLEDHGSEFGLCRTYANETWHFELATTPGGTCPELLHDARQSRP